MKFRFPKFMAILGILLISSFFQNGYSQSKKTNYDVTPEMARKIGYHCQYSQRGLAFFANANNINFSHEADKIVRTLDKHLDYAENFLLALYGSYGIEKGYWALKDMGFAIKEIDIAESIWAKENEKRNTSESESQKANDARSQAEERLLKQKEEKVSTLDSSSSISEIIVDLNDYIGSPDDETDWNYIGFEDENEAKEFEKLLKSKGIYWSNSENAWVKRKEEKVISSLGVGATDLSYSIAGRSAKSLPRPMFNNGYQYDIIIVDIEVNPEGKVVNTKISPKSSIANVSMQKSCLDAALKSRFNEVGYSKNQSGSITYRCRLD